MTLTEAGCGELLDVSTLLKFTKREVKGQDTSVLMRYLIGGKSEEVSAESIQAESLSVQLENE